MLFFSPSTRGFYDDVVHGALTISVLINPDDPDGGVHDIPNPETLIPTDAVEITEADHAALMAAQSTGKQIAFVDGAPAAVDPSTLMTLDQLKAQKLAQLSDACHAAIIAGQTSNALGAAYTYPSGDVDQRNLNANVTASIMPGLPGGWTTKQMCADGSSVWAYRDHTAAQIQKAGVDVMTAIMVCLLKNDGYRAAVAAAADAAAVNAIVWS